MTEIATIATVALETGIAKEVLRKWEARYGFPIPVRDESGNRLYTQRQVNRLKLIKKLLDDGMRPGHVVPLDEAALHALHAERRAANATAGESGNARMIVSWLKSRDPALLRENLKKELQSVGLTNFVTKLMPEMNTSVGDAWERGEIAVRDEHLYSEIVQGLIREALASAINPEGRPRVLLTTPPGEGHTLGILMLEAFLSIEGAYCISLGAQSPLPEIISAAADFDVDVVALSFSVSFPKKKIPSLLKEIRLELPSGIQLWAGGGGVRTIDRTPRGTAMFSDFSEVQRALQACATAARSTRE
jgi:methanogenic corrinoid protein MtbC1